MLRRNPRTDTGAAAVEFALVMMPLLIIVFGLIQYGLYFYSAQTGSNTVHAAARHLAVGNCQTQSELESFVDSRLDGAAAANATVIADYKNADGSPPAAPAPANVEVGGTVTLTVEFPTIDLNFPFVPFMDDPEVSRTVVARIEDTDDQGCPA